MGVSLNKALLGFLSSCCPSEALEGQQVDPGEGAASVRLNLRLRAALFPLLLVAHLWGQRGGRHDGRGSFDKLSSAAKSVDFPES